MIDKPLGMRLGNQSFIQSDDNPYRPPINQASPVFPKLPVIVSAVQPSTGGSGGSFNAGTGGVS